MKKEEEGKSVVLSAELYRRIEEKVKATGFGSVDEYVTFVLQEVLKEERGEEETIWGSMVKQTLKRRKPGFNESYYGFRAFSQLLEEAERQGLITLEHDKRSGGYKVKAVYPDA